MSFFCATNAFPRTSANITALLHPLVISCLCWSTNKELAANRTPVVGCRAGAALLPLPGAELAQTSVVEAAKLMLHPWEPSV